MGMAAQAILAASTILNSRTVKTDCVWLFSCMTQRLLWRVHKSVHSWLVVMVVADLG